MKGSNTQLRKHRIVFLLLLALSGTTEAVLPPKTDTPCANVGARAGGSRLGAPVCCPGLLLTNSWQHANYQKLGCKESALTPPGSDGSCVQCGDGACDSKNFENTCNCPRDCKGL